MDSQSASGLASMSAALQQASVGASLINQTLSKVSEAGGPGGGGAAGVGGIDIDSQKAILSAAYADMGKGTKLDAVV